MITRQQIRAVLSAGGQVVDAAGRHVGRILAGVLSAETFQPAWVTVTCEPRRVVTVPLPAARQLDGCLQLPHTAADVSGASDADGAMGLLAPRRAERLAGYSHSLNGHAHRSDGHANLVDGHREPLDGHAPGSPRRQGSRPDHPGRSPGSRAGRLAAGVGRPRDLVAPEPPADGGNPR